MKTRQDAKAKRSILIADYHFGNVDIERAIIERAGFELVAAQCKTEDEVIEHGRDADGILAQYAPVGARAINAFGALGSYDIATVGHDEAWGSNGLKVAW